MNPLNNIAQKGRLSLGLVFPLESYQGSIPKMEHQVELAQLAESMGFKSLWFRDVPLHDPTFGDAGQMFDPWVYMTHIMNHTNEIALCTGSIILPLRHPIHIQKSISSLQVLSKGRIVIGVASGDRPIEYPAFKQDINQKSELFRDSFSYLKALNEDFPRYESSSFGSMYGNVDVLPKSNVRTPFLVTGHSGQSLDWIAQHADGWLYYPRNISFLKNSMNDWQQALGRNQELWKPYMQSLYVDIVNDKRSPPTPIHLGFKSGTDFLVEYLQEIQSIGVNHVIINLKFSGLPIKETLQQLANHILPKLD